MHYKLAILVLLIVICNKAKPQLHPDRGNAMIWYPTWDGHDLLKSAHDNINVGQIFTMWEWFEKTKDNYDFDWLDEQLELVFLTGKKATIQINGNKHPDYLFNIVPYLKGIALPTQHDHEKGFGPVMYWHPTYKERYQKMIDTLAVHLKNSAYKNVVLGIRQNYNAIGTEHHWIPTEYRNKSAWTIESGVTDVGNFPWTNETGDAYKRWAIDMYIDAFNPAEDINIFMRASAIANGITTDEHIEMVEKGELWLFHTSSEPQPRNSSKNRQYQVFVDYCKKGKTYGFMESWSEAKTNQAKWEWTKTNKTITKAQFNYWTLLVDLHCGATWPAMRDEDYIAFNSDYDMTSKYAGYIAAPFETPGVWIAFREGDYLQGDYTFLMKRRDDDKSTALYNIDDSKYGLWARSISTGSTMCIEINDGFASSITGDKNAKIKITYRDEGIAFFSVKAFGQTFEISREGTNAWKTKTISLNIDEKNNQINITALGNKLTLHKVEVLRGDKKSTGINNEMNKDFVKIYPVPVTDGKLTIENGELGDNFNIEVFHVNGKCLLKKSVKNNIYPTTELLVDELESGYYLLKLSSNIAPIVKPFVIQ